MQSNTVWNFVKLNKCQLEKLPEVKKLKLKNSRPTSDVSSAKK